MMYLNLDKWGNSLGLRIPAHFSKKLGLNQGSPVDLVLEGDHLAIYPRKYDLKSMVAAISDDNCYAIEFPDDTPRGKEVW